MQLKEFVDENQHKMNEIEQLFIEDVFFPYAGENGLDFLNVQAPFEDSAYRTRKLDFFIVTNRFKYVIEIDGYTYHAEGTSRVSPEYFDDLLVKQNDIILNGCILVRFSYNQIRTTPELCINTLRRTFKADLQLNPYYLHNNTFQPTFPQQKALDACSFYREQGAYKGVVLLPTGIGKTIFAAIDAKRLNLRTLFLVHQNNILSDSYEKFNAIWPESSKGFFNATEKNTDAQIIFASKDTLYRDGNIDQFSPDAFEYIIIDEVHHSSCTTYKRITDYFSPKFMVGLTATPERQDRVSILELFDYNIYSEFSQREAIESGYLSGFKYYGLKDDIDYTKIKYNGVRYDLADLGRKLNIPKRNEAIYQKFQDLAKNKKSIGFCVNIQHAEAMSEFFNDKGIPSAAIHSDTQLLPLAERTFKIEQFRNNSIQILFTVDQFNEGVDFPDVEALLFLRPTESKTIFMQQLGRGLRLSPNKSHVIVMDFIGNFRKAGNIREYLTGRVNESDPKGNTKFGVKDFLDWPIGCDVNFDQSVEELFKARDGENRDITEDELKENYYCVKETIRKKPTPDDMNNDEISNYKLVTYRNKFTTWNKFLQSIGEATKASYHYPQGTHLGHIFYVVKTLGDGNDNDLVNKSLYLSESGVNSSLARQTRYKIWACMELGFLCDDRNPSNSVDESVFTNLTADGKFLYKTLTTYVKDKSFFETKSDGKAGMSWYMINNESYFNHFIKNLPDPQKEELQRIFFKMDAVVHMLIFF